MNDPKRPHPVKCLRGPLILIASAMVWSGAGSFYSSHRVGGNEYAQIGIWIAALFFVIGLVLTFGGGQRDD